MHYIVNLVIFVEKVEIPWIPATTYKKKWGVTEKPNE